jgi:hypothetical protein
LADFVVALLYAVVGRAQRYRKHPRLSRRLFQGKWEQIFWSSFLVVIAAFYLSFAAYFGPWPTLGKRNWFSLPSSLFALWLGCFNRPAIAFGYVLHGLWDIAHGLFGSSLLGLPLTEIPVGYGMFCLTFRFHGSWLSHGK